MLNTEEKKEEGENTGSIYEAGYHLVSTLTADEARNTISELKEEMTKVGAEIISEEAPSRMVLAYPMEKNLSNKKEIYKEAYFGWVKFLGEGEIVTGVEDIFKNHGSVLRSLVVKTVREDTFYRKEEPEVYSDDADDISDENDEADETNDEEDKSEEKQKVDERKLDETLDKLVT